MRKTLKALALFTIITTVFLIVINSSAEVDNQNHVFRLSFDYMSAGNQIAQAGTDTVELIDYGVDTLVEAGSSMFPEDDTNPGF